MPSVLKKTVFKAAPMLVQSKACYKNVVRSGAQKLDSVKTVHEGVKQLQEFWIDGAKCHDRALAQGQKDLQLFVEYANMVAAHTKFSALLKKQAAAVPIKTVAQAEECESHVMEKHGETVDAWRERLKCIRPAKAAWQSFLASVGCKEPREGCEFALWFKQVIVYEETGLKKKIREARKPASKSP